MKQLPSYREGEEFRKRLPSLLAAFEAKYGAEFPESISSEEDEERAAEWVAECGGETQGRGRNDPVYPRVG